MDIDHVSARMVLATICIQWLSERVGTLIEIQSDRIQ